MTVVSCQLKYESQNSFTFEDTQTGQLTLEFAIKTDSATQSQRTVFIQAQSATPHALPVPYATYDHPIDTDTDLSLYAKRFNMVARRRNPLIIDCQVQYRPLESGQSPTDPTTPPLSRGPSAWLETYTEMEAATSAILKDATVMAHHPNNQGDVVSPICNSVGQPFETPYEIPRTYPILAQRRYFASTDQIVALYTAYENTVNAATFYSYAAETVKFLSASAPQAIVELGQTAYETVIRYLIKPQGFAVPIVNKGLQYMDGAAELRSVYPDGPRAGRQITNPQLLAKSNGVLIDGGDAGESILYQFENPVSYAALEV